MPPATWPGAWWPGRILNLAHRSSTSPFALFQSAIIATAPELDKIKCNPIKEGLGAFRLLFESTRSDLGVALSSDTVQIVFSTAATAGIAQLLVATYLLTYIVAKTLVLDLIKTLQIEPAARTLPSRIAGTLSGDLATLYSRMDSNQLDIALAIPPVKQIVGNERTWNDANIWGAVFELIAQTSPITPPTAFENAVLETQLRSSSVSQRRIERTHDEVDQSRNSPGESTTMSEASTSDISKGRSGRTMRGI